MNTEVTAIDPARLDGHLLARAGQIIGRGGLVAFPTETVYGLGANALDADAVGRIFTAKGRPATNPLIVHIAEISEARLVTAEWPKAAAQLAQRFWPGPLTLVLPKAAAVPDVVTAGGATVAVRLPAHRVARGLIRAAGVPLAAPSANRSMRISPTRAEHVLAGLAGRIDLVLDGGPTPGGLESTVLDLTTSPPRMLRPGLVSRSEIEAVIGPILLLGQTAERLAAFGPLRSPGLMQRHYAPLAPLECVASDSWRRVEELHRQGARIGWLTLHGAASVSRSGVSVIELPNDPAGYAAGLYAALHAFDAQVVDRIVVEMPPETDDWLAVRDRLRRAGSSD